MQYRIVVRCGSLIEAAHTMPRIEGVVAREDDNVARGGHLIQILTEYPEEFCKNWFEEGFGHLTFTCQME